MSPPTTLLCLLFLTALAGLALWLVSRDRLIAFALLWFFGGLLIESSAVGLEMIYEHRLYLPTMFLGLALVRVLERLLRRRPMGLVFATMGVLCIVFGYWTVERNRLWNDPVAFWTHTAARAPDDARARGQLAMDLMRSGDPRGAVAQLKNALAMDETMLGAYLNLAEISAYLGDDETVVNAYNKALTIHGEDPQILVAFGAFFLSRGKHETAEFLFRRGLALAPNHAGLLYQFGRLYQERKKAGEARKMFERAIAADPGFADAYDNLGKVLFDQGLTEEAIAAFEQGLLLDPASAGRNYNLGYAYEKAGRPAKAAARYERVLQIDPHDVDVLYRYGFLLGEKLGRAPEGVEMLKEAIRVAPEDPRAGYAKRLLAQ